MMLKTGNPAVVKAINKALILGLLRERGPISRADIARISRLNPATVSTLMSELLHEQLVEEVGRGEAVAGRRPELLRLKPQARLAIGVEIGGTRIVVALIDLAGDVRAEIIFPNSCGDAAEVLRQTVAAITGG